jgi:hypothetical protein
MVARADRVRTVSRPHRDLDRFLIRGEAGTLIDESLEAVAWFRFVINSMERASEENLNHTLRPHRPPPTSITRH